MLDRRVASGEFSPSRSINSAPVSAQDIVECLKKRVSRFDFSSEDWGAGPTACSYRHFVDSFDVTVREELYKSLLAEVDAGRAPPRSLLPFVILEPHRRISARAVQDYLRRRQCDVVDEFAGVREIVSIVGDPNTANPGAVLAGLVLICDRRINAIARTARRLLSPADIRDFSRVQRTTLHRCTVEFCLDWLVELSQNYCRQSVENVAYALMLMVVHDEHGVVEDESEIDYLVGFKSTRVRQFDSFEGYYLEVQPILKYLCQREGFESAITKVIELWESHRDDARRLREAAAAA